MKKFCFIFLAAAFVSIIGCASSQPAAVKQDAPQASVMDISSQNQQLNNYSVTGFAYKSAALDTEKWDAWAEKVAPVIKDVVAKIPDGYVLQITGHTDASGPEEPEGDKPGNLKISEERAKTVYNALKRANIDSPKIVYTGVGSSELMKAFRPKDPIQRRVTFKIVKD